MSLVPVIITAVCGFHATSRLSPTRSPLAISLKSAPDERPEERPEIALKPGMICEFHDAKSPPILGLVEGVEWKAKGGARIMLVDQSGTKHAVKENAIHINLGSYKGKLVEPAAILKDYADVMDLESTQLGVDPEALELAWELCAEDERPTFSPKAIVSLVDDALFKNSLDVYKAFRLLTSDLGKIFFKPVNEREYKPKGAKAVRASRENFCRAHDDLDYCLV